MSSYTIIFASRLVITYTTVEGIHVGLKILPNSFHILKMCTVTQFKVLNNVVIIMLSYDKGGTQPSG